MIPHPAVFSALAGLLLGASALVLTLPDALAAGPASMPSHTITVTIDPARRSLSGEDLIRVSPPRALTLTLAAGFTIESLHVDGRASPVDGVVAGGLRRIAVPTAGRIEMRWRGTLDPLDETLSQQAALGDGRLATGERGTFLPAGGGWYPAVHAELERHRVTIDVPETQRALVAGTLVAETVGAGRYRATFDFPHPGRGIDLVAGPYRVTSRSITGAEGKPILLRTYFHPELASLADDYLGSVADYLRRYEKAIGPYPFTMYSVVSSPTPTGFGMPAFTYLGIQVLRLPFIRTTSLGHEVLHNWWGNGVYADPATGNWTEGLTTFMADYAFAEERGADEAYHSRLAWLQEYAALAPADDQPLARFAARSHGASQTVGYGKSTMVFLMLRDEIGRDAFDRAIRRLWREARFQVASWDTLRRLFEAESGRPLDRFFEQWVRRNGAPALRLETLTRANGRASLALTQAEPAFALRVPVVVGSRTEAVRMDGPRERVAVAASGEDRIALDPDLRLFRRLSPGEAPPLLRQASLARDVGLFIGSTGIDAEARLISGRFLEHPARPIETLDAARATATLLVIALDDDLPALLPKLGLTRPIATTPGTARAFAVWSHGRLVTVIAGRDREALASASRTLPFYGRYGWVTFEGARMLTRGIDRGS